MKFTLERRMGRLLEGRIFRLTTPADVEEYARLFSPTLLAGRPVLLADHRAVAIYTQDVAAKLIEMFSTLNRFLDRVAIVVAPTNATLVLQVQRVIREANNPSRRLFTDAGEACEFLGEVLQPLELSRARAFLDQPPISTRGRPPPSR